MREERGRLEQELKKEQQRLAEKERAARRQQQPPGEVSIASLDIAVLELKKTHARDIAVLSLRLKVGADPLSTEFRDALRKARELIHRNLDEKSSIKDEGALGRCDPNIRNPPKIPFAATQRTDLDPRVSVCQPFFLQGPDLQRDVITHEFFHLLGLEDKRVADTNDALANANTLAQIVASPPLPMP